MLIRADKYGQREDSRREKGRWQFPTVAEGPWCVLGENEQMLGAVAPGVTGRE